MTWLSPGTIAIAAALTVPPLVALYFLKLKRRVQVIPSTLLWKRAVYDLQVNSPFQRLRKNLLLLLQLLVLALAAAALGKPMMEMLRARENSLILLIDQSASMAVVEADGLTRLDIAKQQAKKLVDDMDTDGRAMVIAFCDRATTVSPFESNREKLKRLIDTIEPTQSSTELAEAMSLAEAYSQNLVIASTSPGSDLAPTSAAPPATAVVFSDGRVSDAATLSVERLPLESMELIGIGQRQDNVGIAAMSARRDYEKPEILQVYAGVENFGSDAVKVDVALYIDGVHRDVQEVSLAATKRKANSSSGEARKEGESEPVDEVARSPSAASISFDPIDVSEGCLVEVRLQHVDALETDNRAWTVVPPSKAVSVLLVSGGNFFLERALAALPLNLTVMTPDEYEKATEETLTEGQRSKFDVLVFDNHETARLPVGNYFFWGGGPKLEGLKFGDVIDNEFIVNWDEAHPVLRHVAIDGVVVDRWRNMTAPTDASVIVEGESSPVLVHLNRAGSQYLICAFPLVTVDEASGSPMLNTNWIQQLDFVAFMYNAVQFLSGSVATGGLENHRPGEAVEIPVAEKAAEITINRPDGTNDTVAARGYPTVHYAKTRTVGVYQVKPAVEGQDRFAVNLFDAEESFIAPAASLVLGSANLEAQSAVEKVNDPVWAWFLLAGLAMLMLEWLIYNRRIWV